MSQDVGRVIDLIDDTRLNVASLLLEPVGSTRRVRFSLTKFPLDIDLQARSLDGTARLTRLKTHLLVDAEWSGIVELECAACLAGYDQPIHQRFSERFAQTVDVRSGSQVNRQPDDHVEGYEHGEPGFAIDESHELDLAEALRQWTLLAIPMQPSCGPDCPGPLMRSTGDDEAVDDRLASLARLLDDEQDGGTRER